MTDKGQELFSGTQDVLEAHRIDTNALQAYMEEHVEGFSGNVELSEFKGGQSNPTYKIKAGGQSYVMRRKPPGKLLPSAHAVDREYRVIAALGKTGFPVPKTYALCEDDSIIGTAFYIMSFADGRIFWDPSLPGMENDERTAIYNGMNDVIAQLHMTDYKAIDLETFGKPGNYFERQIGRWSKQYKASETESIPEMDKLIEWLPDNIPAGDETTIVHGDYRLDNMVFHPTEPRVIAVLDWELSTLGHPLGDFSYHAMVWAFEPKLFRGLAGLDLKGLGIPTTEEYVAAYCKKTGRDGIENWDFYMAYNMFRLAGIAQGIMGRVRDGTAASEHAMETASKVRPMSEQGWSHAMKVIAGG
ncbi:MAG: phosphotransferase [Alphaproteobacteria bacterium]|jgi:aminoglycoside phosphotransferase (APT) family kinase protein|nr:phosphotransferase [Alphaproteobacteria bacterium]MBT4017416.1 phosphotransferase [Alphaproteobacteria bacterium]MBT4965929.1 phosphotransferase [Alphaproteobacteria bacterium]MBT5159136.1 phosphotransferase [Alphaproteobacteria bacterium]MBT5920021.1 phosphotransferase [Alphaproteobacteria bacterium]